MLPLCYKQYLHHSVSTHCVSDICLLWDYSVNPLAEMSHLLRWFKVWCFQIAKEYGPMGGSMNSKRNFHFRVIRSETAMWRDALIHHPESAEEGDPAVLVHPTAGSFWSKALTAVQSVFLSGTRCCPQVRAGCSLCAGPQWTYSRALICPLNSPRYFPHFQSQNYNKRRMLLKIF